MPIRQPGGAVLGCTGLSLRKDVYPRDIHLGNVNRYVALKEMSLDEITMQESECRQRRKQHQALHLEHLRSKK